MIYIFDLSFLLLLKHMQILYHVFIRCALCRFELLCLFIVLLDQKWSRRKVKDHERMWQLTVSMYMSFG